ncbi:MAG: response regulator [Ruminiclostridium sp.]|nr:response regulator [Ruminiclostridium sp.]
MVYYQLALYAAITLSGLFLWKWNRHISVSFTLVFLLIPFINLGYFRVAVAENISEAVLANGLVYICTCFLQLSYMTYVFSFCKVKLPKILSATLFVLSSVIGAMSLATHRNHLIYDQVLLDRHDGITHIVKTYGPMHKVYYIMIGFYLVLDFIILFIGFRKKDVSKKHILMLFILFVINLAAFVINRTVYFEYEVQPVAYLLTEVVLLIMSRRLRIYAVADTAVSTLMQEGKTAFVSFDISRHYLGYSGPALEYLPELAELYIDGPLYKDNDQFTEIHKWLNAVYSTGKPAEFDTERESASLHIIASCVYSRKKPICYQIRIEDRTDERKYINLLQKAKQSAEDVSRAKGDFLANMSHEIRTPINAILGMDEMILRESSDEQTLEYAEDIRKAGNTLLGLINDVLDFSKIEAGKMDIIPVDYQLSSVLNDLSNIIQPRAGAKGLKFLMKVKPTTPDYLHGDEIRLKQIIMNILTNAVKYTKEGSVTLSVSSERDGNFVDIRFSVADTGIGIKKEDIDKLYIAFERIEENRNRSIEGTGLGMTITQRLLALMDSRLEVESEYGKGSVFSFTLRQEIVKDTQIGDYESALERSLSSRKKYRESFKAPYAKVLVVDDVEMNLLVFKKLLKKTDIRIDTASSGEMAVRLAKVRRYDLIFLDHRMPNKDGIETLAEIRADKNNANCDTPAVCLTANAVSGVREQYIAAGFCEYITKPIDPHKLEALIIELLPKDLVILGEPEEVSEEEEKQTESSGEAPAAASAPDSAILDIYLNSIDEMSDLIEKLYNEEDWANYTIKVHALKSTSRLVNETGIADLAERMEHAGDSGDIDAIRENTAKLLEMYRAVKLKYNVPEKSAEEAEEKKDLPEISEDLLEDAYAAIGEAVRDLDYDALCDVLDELNTYSFPEAHRQRIADINAAADNVDWGALKTLMRPE